MTPPHPAGHLRDARPSDAASLAAVQVASWHAAYRGLVPDATLDAFTVETRSAAWTRNLGAPREGVTTRVLEREGRVLGFASCGPSRDEEGAGEVWALYAAPDVWGTGAGRALLEDGLAALAARGLASVHLWVLEGNARAIRFYEAAGFRLDGEQKIGGELPHLSMRREARGRGPDARE